MDVPAPRANPQPLARSVHSSTNEGKLGAILKLITNPNVQPNALVAPALRVQAASFEAS